MVNTVNDTSKPQAYFANDKRIDDLSAQIASTYQPASGLSSAIATLGYELHSSLDADVGTNIGNSQPSTYSALSSYVSTAIEGLQTSAQVSSLISTAVTDLQSSSQVSSAISTAISGLQDATQVSSAISTAVSGLQDASQVSTAIATAVSGLQDAAQVSTAISTATTGLQSASQVSSAISTAVSGLQSAAQVTSTVSAAITAANVPSQSVINSALTNLSAFFTALSNAGLTINDSNGDPFVFTSLLTALNASA